MDFTVRSEHRDTNNRKRKTIHVLRPCQRIEKAIEIDNDGDTNYNLSASADYPKVRGLKELEISGRAETIQIAALMSSIRILGKVPET